MKKLFSLLALLLCVSILLTAIGCKSEDADHPSTGEEQGPSSTDPDASTEPVVNGLGIVVNGEARYRVVRGDLEDTAIRDAMMNLIKAIETATGVRPQPATDWEEYDESIKEIIIGGQNNRPAAQGIVDALGSNAFRICAVDDNIVIAGSSDETTTMAVEHFIATYLSAPTTVLEIPKTLDVTMTVMEYQTLNHDKTVTLKHSYSDYIEDYYEEPLLCFDEGETGYGIERGGFYDNDHSIDGFGALRWDLKGEIKNVTKLVNYSSRVFSFDASDKNATTLKFWLYVSNAYNVVCDHDAGYGNQGNQATFYFRVIDKNGRTHAWNHTITNAGWHEIELSFNIHNGADSTFDYENVVGFWFGLATYDDVTILIDDMRGVTYDTDYKPAEITGENNPRLISDAEYNALDGAILQEWYGASYDMEDKVQGESSLRSQGDATVNDFRTIIANLDIPMDHDKDELVFHFKVADVKALASVFIELNQVQDSHEFSATFTMDALKKYGFTGENDTWCEIRIPLSVFNVQLGKNMGESVQLCNFRFVGSANGSAVYDYHIDHIYLVEK